MPVPDLFRQGMQQGWRVFAAHEPLPPLPPADVIIIGSGAGGATSAEILSRAGLQVYILEEGGLHTSQDFANDELKAYAELYQEGALRATADGGIGVLQGRTVGGTTTVNWTTSFRTPNSTLQQWQQQYGIEWANATSLAPWFASVEQRLNVAPWAMAPNANNDIIRKGCETLGLSWDIIPRNVKGCWNLGYCGTGCPVNAKQSMLVTSLPAALEHGAVLIHSLRIERLAHNNQRVTAVHGQAMNATFSHAEGPRLQFSAPWIIVAGGAINSPALLLRSFAPNPYATLGKRTFLHPVVMSLATFAEPINGFYGAPQSVYSDAFNEVTSGSQRMGYKLEVPPMQPSITSALMGQHGEGNWQRVKNLAHSHLMLALMRDGFFPDDPGGTVQLRKNGDPVLDYPLRQRLFTTAQHALEKMAEIQFAAGAQEVVPLHSHALGVGNMRAYHAMTRGLAWQIHNLRIASAHVMGGCAMGPEAANSVVNLTGQHHQLENLYVFDGSLFPTSIGANPQLSIYAVVSKLANEFLRAAS